MEHISIFEKVKNYKSDPLIEYNKISNFLKSETCSYKVTVLKVIMDYYPECSLLSNTYPTFEECINNNVKTLIDMRLCDYNSLDESEKETILDEFLIYCEVLLYCYHHIYNEVEIEYYEFDYSAFSRTDLVVAKSLNSIGYQYNIDSSNKIIKISKINPFAEGIALTSMPPLAESIESYLALRNSDIKHKTSTLLCIINLLEPTLKKFENQALVGKVKEYSQLLRHPEIYKEKDEYKWFYENEKKHLDDLFNLCLFAQQYSVANEIINKFDINKKN